MRNRCNFGDKTSVPSNALIQLLSSRWKVHFAPDRTGEQRFTAIKDSLFVQKKSRNNRCSCR